MRSFLSRSKSWAAVGLQSRIRPSWVSRKMASVAASNRARYFDSLRLTASSAALIAST